MRCMGGLRTLPWTPPLRGWLLIPPHRGRISFLDAKGGLVARLNFFGGVFLFGVFLVLFLNPVGVVGDGLD